ncbi:tRNA (5-methylaminomethyl-2-thiouridine)(34)-methyltransferase MnmD [Candidatus Sulfidibacterium hydrothermale]|uniref:tRNA (5-methylaminomethyl-2-thiouridine)(34)-methyltransferase MnmD n=1 Tax=Candidatus Sulfidibacterium hydrothermale TaxID=2875962 RepID=UPI001F0A25D9|nr:tRNA (5-methylaminomethyl-2-thiouridine)(34)-methyltransferase MnmD [Candidatus Sulfidibacterium hydrothermale]UBM61452.1 tRNA (5-methylaminomethyl-2-thiouridine)(34)-methyltransferase MnmD [Candidatus Sulfidibacterium hydrothermale]
MKTGALTVTRDGSHTLYNERAGEHYHSTFGAIQESKHIFIQAGLSAYQSVTEKLQVLEIGFGTGLNALLTLLWAEKNHQKIKYCGVEAFPLPDVVIKQLNYPELLHVDRALFEKMHQAKAPVWVSSFFEMQLLPVSFQEYEAPLNHFHVIYFDAFSPESQPEMWTEEGFLKLYKTLVPQGILVTYSCKGSVKRALKAAGFQIEKLPGPPGKREFLRAVAKK